MLAAQFLLSGDLVFVNSMPRRCACYLDVILTNCKFYFVHISYIFTFIKHIYYFAHAPLNDLFHYRNLYNGIFNPVFFYVQHGYTLIYLYVFLTVLR